MVQSERGRSRSSALFFDAGLIVLDSRMPFVTEMRDPTSNHVAFVELKARGLSPRLQTYRQLVERKVIDALGQSR